MVDTSYYILRSSSDPKIVGIRDGGSQTEIYREGFSDKSNYDRYYNYFADRSNSSIRSKTDIPDFDFELEYVRLMKHAKLTDFLHYYPWAFGANFLMSERSVALLEKYSLANHKKYLAKVYYDGKNFVPYYLVYFPILSPELIDFPNSTFYRGSQLIGKEYFKLMSYDEYWATNGVFAVEKLVFKKDFDKNLDLFHTVSTHEFIISLKLKEAIQSEGLTGINLIEANGPYRINIITQ